ncbi:MAG: hypothetical protein WB502_05190 [Thermoactinomyces sp.]
MKKIPFVCQGCGKRLKVQEDIYEKVYAKQGKCLSCQGKDRKK